jgi:hypothetical protein
LKKMLKKVKIPLSVTYCAKDSIRLDGSAGCAA